MTDQNPTPTIDVHAHFLPECYRRALSQAGLLSLDRGMPIPEWSAALALEVMGRNHIDKAILSVSSPGLNPFSAETEPSIARGINEALAALKITHPDRFGGFATLPLGDIPAALVEIGHALDVLRLDGFIIETNHRGAYPCDAVFAPVLAELNARRAIVFLHPTSPYCQHCGGFERPAPLIDFPFDTTRAVVQMLYSGIFALYPDIRFILAHAGGTLPFLAQRIAGFTALPVADAAPGIDAVSVKAQLGRLYYDTALSASTAQMFALRQLVAVDRILFGSDWPFSPEPLLSASLASLETMDIFDQGERNAIFGLNAQKLLEDR